MSGSRGSTKPAPASARGAASGGRCYRAPSANATRFPEGAEGREARRACRRTEDTYRKPRWSSLHQNNF